MVGDCVKVSETSEAVAALEKEVGFSLQGYIAGTSLVPRRLQISVTSLADYLRQTLGLTTEGIYMKHVVLRIIYTVFK